MAAQYPDRVTRWVVIDAPLPGIGDWDNIVRSPMLWHFDFRGPDEERLVQGRERIYLDRFWNELYGDPRGSMKVRGSTLLHCTRGRVRCTMPSSNLGHSARTLSTTRRCSPRAARSPCRRLPSAPRSVFGKNMADHMQFAASNVTGGIVPDSGHWIMEDNPQATIKLVTDFLAK